MLVGAVAALELGTVQELHPVSPDNELPEAVAPIPLLVQRLGFGGKCSSSESFALEL